MGSSPFLLRLGPWKTRLNSLELNCEFKLCASVDLKWDKLGCAIEGFGWNDIKIWFLGVGKKSLLRKETVRGMS